MAWSKMVPIELDDEEKLDAHLPIPMNKPDYPPGTQFCLTASTLEKLGLEADCDKGDLFHFRGMAEVKHCHKEGDLSRVELQITHLSVEDENEEDYGD